VAPETCFDFRDTVGRPVSAFANMPEIAPHVIWDGVTGRVIAGDRVTFAVIELEPNVVVPEHSHENEQLGVLAQGSLSFRIGGEERELRPGATWRIPGGVPHDVQTGPDGAVVVEVFAPARGDWAGLERLDPSAPLWPASG
jgi:quercetin dioxygenase-like cupin family protein